MYPQMTVPLSDSFGVPHVLILLAIFVFIYGCYRLGPRGPFWH